MLRSSRSTDGADIPSSVRTRRPPSRSLHRYPTSRVAPGAAGDAARLSPAPGPKRRQRWLGSRRPLSTTSRHSVVGRGYGSDGAGPSSSRWHRLRWDGFDLHAGLVVPAGDRERLGEDEPRGHQARLRPRCLMRSSALRKTSSPSMTWPAWDWSQPRSICSRHFMRISSCSFNSRRPSRITSLALL